MKYIFLLIIMSIFTPVAIADAQQVTATKVPAGESLEPLPRLVLDQPVHDAGEIEAGTTIAHEFIIKNEGSAPLLISEVRAGCGCIISSFDRDIEPGKTGRVTITMNIYREWAGHSLRRTAWVMSNDPVSPQVRLTIGASIKPAEDPSPARP